MRKLISFLVVIGIISCETNDTIEDEICLADPVIIDESLYEQTITNNYTIERVELVDACLSITINSSGCDGNSWGAILIDSGIDFSPPKRLLKLSLSNAELCQAEIQKTFTFDVSTLRLFFTDPPPNPNDRTAVPLFIEGWNEVVTLYNPSN